MASCSLSEKRIDPFTHLCSVRRSGELLQLAIEMRIEAIHAGRLIQQLFRDGKRVRRAGGQPRGEATTRSHDIAIPNPPAAATPSTAATNGFGARRISEIALWMYSRICLNVSPYP